MIHTKDEMLNKAHKIMKDLQNAHYKDNCVIDINFHKDDDILYPKKTITDTWVATIKSLFNNVDLLTISDITGEPIYYQNFTTKILEIAKDENGKYYRIKKEM